LGKKEERVERRIGEMKLGKKEKVRTTKENPSGP